MRVLQCPKQKRAGKYFQEAFIGPGGQVSQCRKFRIKEKNEYLGKGNALGVSTVTGLLENPMLC